jgi:hypothetical protein
MRNFALTVAEPLILALMGQCPYRAYLMSSISESGASFRVLDAKGKTIYSASVGPDLGTWSHSQKLTYRIYALDFNVPEALQYSIAVAGRLNAQSPNFAVASPESSTPDCCSIQGSSTKANVTARTISRTACGARPDI